MNGTEYDYVVVGGGSAGCVLARRLSDDPSVTVCLLEAGKPDTSWLIQVPAAFSVAVPRPLYNWAFETVPQPGLNGRRGYQPRGKVLGGSSSINAMVYVRGHPTDYDAWAAQGNSGWGYADVLPYFKKSQHQERGEDAYHGSGGPLNVTDLCKPNPLADVFVEAAAAAQFPLNGDFNGERQEGIGRYQVNQKNGERCSAAKGYLTPVLGRQNLTVITGAHATRIILEDRTAKGVEYRQGKQNKQAHARAEVILSGGAFQSPQLLMLSGIGPGAQLREQSISVVHELPGAGQNLQDHIDYVGFYGAHNHHALGISLGGMVDLLKAIFQWKFQRTGMLTSNLAEAGGFLCSDPTLQVPDLQLHFVTGGVDDHGRELGLGHAYSCHVCILRPHSRGHVGLTSPDPLAAPLIDPQFLTDDRDLELLVKGFKLMQQIMDTAVFAEWGGSDRYAMGVSTDAEIAELMRNRADTIYHPVGTCKMGPDNDPLAVVDSQLRVRGIDRLRVVDASIMPTLIGGNTNAPTIMIAEKASDMIRGVS